MRPDVMIRLRAEYSVLIAGGEEANDGEVKAKPGEEQYQTKRRDQGGGQANLLDGINPGGNYPEEKATACIEDAAEGHKKRGPIQGIAGQAYDRSEVRIANLLEDHCRIPGRKNE